MVVTYCFITVTTVTRVLLESTCTFVITLILLKYCYSSLLYLSNHFPPITLFYSSNEISLLCPTLGEVYIALQRMY